MHVDYTPQQKALRAEIRAYFSKLVTPELRSGLEGMEGGPHYREVIRRMGGDGWLGVGWPKEYGGQGRTRGRAADLLRGGPPRGRSAALRDAQHRGPAV